MNNTMNDAASYQASCFCGDVQFTLRGEPAAMAYCHCASCRQWSAGPVSAFTLWSPEAIHIMRGAENMAVFDKTPGTDNETVESERTWCKTCGGHVYTGHPAIGLVDVPAVVIRDFAFTPGFHVHYRETVHRMKDGLPKFRDLPKQAGGSGVELPE